MKIPFLYLFTMLVGTVFSQNVWTLNQCLNYAQTNNLDIKSIDLDQQRAEMSEKYSKYLKLPTLNASTGYNFSFGRTIDPTSNQFVSSNYDNQSYSLSSGATIYNGSIIRNRIKLAQANADFFRNQKIEVQEQILYSVVEVYYNILIAKENLELAQQNLNNNQTQLRRIKALVDAGASPITDLQEAEAQQANLDYQVMQAENMIQAQILRLNQILNKQDQDPITDVEDIDVQIEERYAAQDRDYSSLESEMLQNNYTIKRAESSVLQSKINRDIAKGGYYPTLGAGLQASTNYSSTFQEPNITGEFLESEPNPVLIDGAPSQIVTFSPEVVYNDVPYFNQLENNFGWGFGLNLSIPIFNQRQVKANVISSDIDVKKSEYSYTQSEYDLKAQLKNLLFDIENTWRNYQSSQKLTDYNRIVYENTQKRQEAGAASLFEVELARTNYENSFIDQLNNKYNLALQLHRLDYMRGKSILTMQF